MALTLVVTDHWEDGRRFHLLGKLTPSGNYPTGGDTVPFNDPLIKSGSAPVWFTVQGAGGYNYVGVPGALFSTPPNAKLQAFVDSTGLEVAAGAYPAGLVANPPVFYAIFLKHI